VWNEKWGDEGNCSKADDSQKCFLFTLKNPYNVAARRCELKYEKRHKAILCDSEWGPCFRGTSVSDNCNTNAGSYTNDAGLNAERFFTDSQYFKVREIEVFEIRD
jgi:hypothetical protein